MSGHLERQALFARLDTLESSMSALLDVLESPDATAESIEHAANALTLLEFEPARCVDAFRGSPALELARVRGRLGRLADLDALLRDECARALTRTSIAIEQVRCVRAQLDALAPADDTGTTFDCVR